MLTDRVPPRTSSAGSTPPTAPAAPKAFARPGTLKHRLVTGATRMHVRLYRLTGGRIGGRAGDVRVCLLTTTGRRSGAARTSAMACFPVGEDLVVVASNAGSDRHPAWYLNISSDPRAEVRVGAEVRAAVARTATAEERTALWQHVTSRAPVYLEYQAFTSRDIPLVILGGAAHRRRHEREPRRAQPLPPGRSGRPGRSCALTSVAAIHPANLPS